VRVSRAPFFLTIRLMQNTKSVPRRIHYFADFRLTEAQWDDLRISIQLAFFSTARRTKETSLFNWTETSSHYTKSGDFRRHCEL
jgi:hypothetical protein